MDPFAPAVEAERQRQAKTKEWFEGLGKEVTTARCQVYLLTFSRLLPETIEAATAGLRDLTNLTRQELAEFVRESFENPEGSALGGRPILRTEPLVRKVVVVAEEHADGTWHFHAAVQLYQPYRWPAVKRALRNRYRLVAHFSCTHKEWWSVLRYVTHTTDKKPIVDSGRVVWLAQGESFDAYKESQQSYDARVFRASRETQEMTAPPTDKPKSFTKLDFNSLVLSEGLNTRSAVIRYVQDHGSVGMQAFVANHQKCLNELVELAKEWGEARQVAAAEELTDWALLCQTAEKSCPHEDNCRYHKGCEEIFEGNKANSDKRHLAASLRNIIVAGPSKDTRVPFLAGATNTGKSTLVDGFDDLYGFERVFHLPALTDGKFALRNWMKEKRFVYWDEFDPVEFANKGVFSPTTFKKAFGGQWFEIQVAQNHHDGNKDWRWKRGVVFTNKLKGLFTAKGDVSTEDINHLKSRVELFRFTFPVVSPGSRPVGGNVPACKYHMAQWIRDLATAFDAMQGLQALPRLGALVHAQTDAVVADLRQFLEAANLPQEARAALTRDVEGTGAVHVQELGRQDWEQLVAWPALRPMEQRRLLQQVPP
jgi:hypothetical protein